MKLFSALAASPGKAPPGFAATRSLAAGRSDAGAAGRGDQDGIIALGGFIHNDPNRLRLMPSSTSAALWTANSGKRDQRTAMALFFT